MKNVCRQFVQASGWAVADKLYLMLASGSECHFAIGARCSAAEALSDDWFLSEPRPAAQTAIQQLVKRIVAMKKTNVDPLSWGQAIMYIPSKLQAKGSGMWACATCICSYTAIYMIFGIWFSKHRHIYRFNHIKIQPCRLDIQKNVFSGLQTSPFHTYTSLHAAAGHHQANRTDLSHIGMTSDSLRNKPRLTQPNSMQSGPETSMLGPKMPSDTSIYHLMFRHTSYMWGLLPNIFGLNATEQNPVIAVSS